MSTPLIVLLFATVLSWSCSTFKGPAAVIVGNIAFAVVSIALLAAVLRTGGYL